MSPIWRRVSVYVPGFNLSQTEWIVFIRNAVSNAPPHLQGYLRTLATHGNVPRKQPQFANHVQTTFHLLGQPGSATSDRLWSFLKGELGKQTAIALSKQNEQLTNAQGGGSSNSTDANMSTQSTASLMRRQAAKQAATTSVVTATSVAAAQLPLENRTTSTVAVSRKKLIDMKIVADDQTQPLSGFHPQYQTTGRTEVRVIFQKEENPAAIPSAILCKRIREWDPFWDPTLMLVTGLTGNVASPKGKTWANTAAQVTVDLEKARRENGPVYNQEEKCEWGKKKTIRNLRDGESRLLLKMIPLFPPSGTGKKAKADGHLWPKGTFLQITTGVTAERIRIQQRKQQQHNDKLWKGMSNYLDLTEHISSRQPFKIEMICHDEEPFFICVAFCRYRSADRLFKLLTTPTSIAPIRRVCESKEEAQRKIVDLASSQMIVLDDDDGSPEKEENAGVFSFSLIDSYSKKLIKTPVRGCRCSHFQVRSFVVACRPHSCLVLLLCIRDVLSNEDQINVNHNVVL
jgi:hypothetical protein